MEAAILVKGVPEAIFQGFPTEAEARLKFDQEYRKGNTKIVLETAPRSQRRVEREAPSTPPFEVFYSVESTASAPSTPSTRTRRGHTGSDQASTVYQSAPEWLPTPNNVRKGSSQPPTSQPKYAASPISRTASEPSATQRQLHFDALFEKHQRERVHGQGASHTRNGYEHAAVAAVGSDDFEARAISSPVSDRGHRVAPASRPLSTTRTESVRSTSPGTDSDSQPKIVVKTPSWLGQYPKGPKDSPSMASSSLLSPLASTNFPLNSAMGRSHTAPSTPRGRLAPSMMGSPSTHHYSHSPHYPGLSTAQSSVIDPRSPIDSHAKIPELTYVQYVFSAWPSSERRLTLR